MDNIDKNRVWHECLEGIKVLVSPAIFSTWFSQTHLIALNKTDDRTSIEIGCPSTYIKNTIEIRYYGMVQDCLNKALNQKCDLIFSIKELPENKPSGLETPLFASSKPDFLNNLNYAIQSSKLRPDYNFENFAVSGSNQMAWAAADAVAKNPGKAYNPLFIWGGVGVGKTHLMMAVGLDMLTKDQSKKVYLCTGEDFTNDIVEGIRKKSTQAFRNKYRKLNALLVDDIQFIAGKDAVQEEFFHTFNAIVSAGGQVIMTSDRPPQEISKLEERLRSRFEAGLIVDIAPPDFELRCAITQIKIKEKGLNLSDEIVRLIAGNADSPRKILGILTRLSSELIFRKSPAITEDMVRSILGKGDGGNGHEKKVSPDELTDAICRYFNIGKRALMGNSRTQKLALPRQILMYLLRTDLQIQYAEVGRLIGGRDHTTVMHAVDKITRLASDNVQIREDIAGIKKTLRG